MNKNLLCSKIFFLLIKAVNSNFLVFTFTLLRIYKLSPCVGLWPEIEHCLRWSVAYNFQWVYRVTQNLPKQVLRISRLEFCPHTIQLVVIPHGNRDLSSLPWTGEAAVQISWKSKVLIKNTQYFMRNYHNLLQAVLLDPVQCTTPRRACKSYVLMFEYCTIFCFCWFRLFDQLTNKRTGECWHEAWLTQWNFRATSLPLE